MAMRCGKHNDQNKPLGPMEKLFAPFIQPQSVRRWYSMSSPPSFGVMLIGKDSAMMKKVGNILLGTKVFHCSKPNQPFINYTCKKYIEVSMAELSASDLSEATLREGVKQCMSLCVLGPQALVLVVDPRDFDQQQREWMEQVMDFFSDQSRKHAVVFIYEETREKNKKENVEIENIIRNCGGRMYIWRNNQKEALKAIEEMVFKTYYSRLTYEDAEEAFEDLGEDADLQRPASSSSSGNLVSPAAPSSGKITLVLCGSNASVKSSVADLILSLEEKTGRKQQPMDKVEDSSTCVKREGHVCGHHVTLIQLPSLESCQASEEALWKETFECLRLSDPGVHAFLLITSQGQLTDEDKSASKTIGHYFGQCVSAFCLRVLAEHGETRDGRQGREISQGPDFVLDDTSKVGLLLERVMKMREENGGCYTHAMFNVALLGSHLRCHRKLQEMKSGSKEGVEENLRIVLLGKTGQGKSASGNTILGKDVFKEAGMFRSETAVCQKETVVINGRPITVIDTPGLFDTETDNEVTKKEIVKCIGMAAPGPHVFLLVKEIGRFTEEERKAMEMIKEMFGNRSAMYTIVLFTHGDKLKGVPLDLQDFGSGMTSLLRTCGMRHHVIDNQNKNNKVQVNELLSKIDSLVEVNGGRYYTNEMFEEVEKTLQQEQERILLEKKEEIEREKQELQAKHQADMEKLKKEMEEEKRRQEEETKRREEEFRSKENSMRESMKEAMEKMEEEDRRKTKAMDEEYQRKKQENEEWIKERTKEIHSEREEWERKTREEQRRREEEEEKRRVKEMEEKRQRQKSQEEERDKLVENMRVTFEEDKMRKRQEYEERAVKEKEKQDELEEKIKHAEQSKVKELEEQKKKHMEECQRNQDEEEKRMKEEKTKWSETLESKQREWKHKQEEEQKRYEKEKLEEKKKRDTEEKQRKIQEEQERQKIEQDTQRNIKETEDRVTRLQKEYQQKQQEQEQRNRVREEKHRAEKEEELRLQKEKFEEQMEKESKTREEEKRRNIEFLTKTHEKEKDLLRRETELAARKQAEEEFNKELDKKVGEAKSQGHTKGHEEGKEAGKKEGLKEGEEKGKAKVEAERSVLGRRVDGFFSYF